MYVFEPQDQMQPGQYTNDFTNLTNGMKEVCMLEEFFKNEEKKPPHLRARAANLYCPCSKCNPTSC